MLTAEMLLIKINICYKYYLRSTYAASTFRGGGRRSLTEGSLYLCKKPIFAEGSEKEIPQYTFSPSSQISAVRDDIFCASINSFR